MFIVPFDGILINKNSMSKLALQCVESKDGTSSANENKSFMAY